MAVDCDISGCVDCNEHSNVSDSNYSFQSQKNRLENENLDINQGDNDYYMDDDKCSLSSKVSNKPPFRIPSFLGFRSFRINEIIHELAPHLPSSRISHEEHLRADSELFTSFHFQRLPEACRYIFAKKKNLMEYTKEIVSPVNVEAITISYELKLWKNGD